MMDDQLRAVLAQLRKRLEGIYGPRLVHIVLFGSQARGEADLGSDIDVLVVLQGPVYPSEEIARTGGAITALSLEYDTVVSCVFMSMEQYETERSPLLLNIHREGIAA